MVPLSWEAAEYVFAWEDGSRRGLALHHAVMERRPGLWGDHARRPNSMVLLRRGETRWEAFGAGDPQPAVNWLTRRPSPVALLAPAWWSDEVRKSARGKVEVEPMAIRYLPEPEGAPRMRERAGASIATRRLGPDDAPLFDRVAPPWALRCWGSAADALTRGAAFAVGDRRTEELLALAWITEFDHHLDAIGAYTVERYRRLGLGRAAAGALVGHILARRGKAPVWACADQNLASTALARSLGFNFTLREPVFYFGRGDFDHDPGPDGPKG